MLIYNIVTSIIKLMGLTMILGILHKSIPFISLILSSVSSLNPRQIRNCTLHMQGQTGNQTGVITPMLIHQNQYQPQKP